MNQVQAKYKLVGSPLQKVGVLLLLILFIRPDVQAEANSPALASGPDSNVPSITQQREQKKLVKGTVSDDTGELMIGATISIKGTTQGVLSDINGNYEIECTDNDILQVSYLGYTPQDIKVGNRKVINVVLASDNVQLEEVQIIAYGTQKKLTVTGSVSSIDTKDLLKSPTSSIGNMLAGSVSGISTVQYSGQPGAEDPEIFVRGIASLDGARSQPLILVDGVERSFFRMDPNEIENITVLKDASATAVFGVRGANGVILVTTRRGKEGRTEISLSSSVGISEAMRVPEMMGSYDHAKYFNEMQLSDNPNLGPNDLRFSPYVLEMFRTNADPIMFPNTNWEDLMFKKASLQTQHNLNISGGTKDVKFFISLGYLYQDGLLKRFYESYNPNYKNNRYNYRANLDINVTKSTTLKLGLGGRLETKKDPKFGEQNNLWMEILRVQPFSSPGFVDGNLVQIKNRYIPMTMRNLFSMYYGKGYTETSQNTMNLDMDLTQKLDFITKGLSFNIKGAYNTSYTGSKSWNGSMESYTPVYKSSLTDPGLAIDDPNFDHTIVYQLEGTASALSASEDWSTKTRDWYVEASLRYDRTFRDHKVGGLLLYNMTKQYYPKANTDIPKGYLGLVGRVTYAYKDRYLVDFNAGYNGSENFAPGKRYGFFPAASLGWVISEEKFMKQVDFISFLKLRASYGLVGNDILNEYKRFLYLPDSYSASSGGYYWGVNTPQAYPGASELILGNPDVTWEKAAKQNYGLDMNLLDQRLSFSLDVFFEKRKDILIQQNTVPGFVAADLPAVNLGKVNNKGYEISLGWNDKIGSKFRYWLKGNVSFSRNEIVYKDEIPQNEPYMYETGRSIGLNYGYVFDRFFEAKDFNEDGSTITGIPVQSGTFKPGDILFKDLNNDGVIDGDDKTYFGYGENPEYIFGLNAGFEYKGFDFSMNWTGATNVSRRLEEDFTRPFNTGDAPLMKWMVEERWTEEKGQSAQFPRFTQTNRMHNSQMSDFWVRDASYLRLKNLEIGYTLNTDVLKKVGIQKLRVFANGYNLLTFDHLGFIDPESKISNKNKYPNTRIYNFGVNVNF